MKTKRKNKFIYIYKCALLFGIINLIEYDSDVETQHGYFDYQITVEIKWSKYEEVDLSKVTFQQTHLSDVERTELKDLLSSYPELFNGKLKKEYKRPKVYLLLKKNGSKPSLSNSFCSPGTLQRGIEEVN